MALTDSNPEPKSEFDEQVHATVRGGIALWTLFLGFAMLTVGNGLNLAVLGVRMVDEGFGVRTSGVLRFLFGFCMAGLYVVVESWLNDASTPHTRGRTLAVYMTASMGGLGVGQP